jgi:hypothetical protein
MRHVPLAALVAALVACSPRVPAAQEVPARFGAYSVEAVDEVGRALPTFDHRGRTYVLGRLGERYLLRFHNGTGRRVEVVASVDGRDVVDGRTASVSRRGYVVEPWGELSIDGFRVSQEAVAAFRFSSVPRSYAARKGDARDVGVVGVAVFPERRPRHAAPARRPWAPAVPAPYLEGPGGAGSPGDDAGAAPPPQASRGEGGPADRSASAPERGIASAPNRAKAAERPGLGTEFGEEHASRVESTTFEREGTSPAAVLTFRYDDREGLLALGIDVDGRGGRDAETWRRERASPFRADAAYCEPPPGWRPGVR